MIYLTKNDWKNLFHPSKKTVEAKEQYCDYLNKNIQTEEINGEYFIYSSDIDCESIKGILHGKTK